MLLGRSGPVGGSTSAWGKALAHAIRSCEGSNVQEIIGALLCQAFLLNDEEVCLRSLSQAFS